jgi:hypothetical protein
MVHIKLITIKRQLQQKMHYPETAEQANGRPTLDEAFDTLLFGFDKWLQRHGMAGNAFMSVARQRGWFSERYADLFTEYCIPGWRIV